MAKEIILYSLRNDVEEVDYAKWCEDCKVPLLIGLPGSKSFTLLKMMGGVQRNGHKGSPPTPTKPRFNYIGILDAPSPEEWGESRDSKAFRESFSQWLSKWAADFCILEGIELYHAQIRLRSKPIYFTEHLLITFGCSI
jgi:hypothetical protein